mgnify:FL=1
MLPIHEVFYIKGNEEKIDLVLKILSTKGEFKVRRKVTVFNEPIFDENNVLIGGKFGRKSNRKIPTLKDGNLANVPAVLYPFIFYIIDREEQIILLQYNSDAFQKELAVFDYLTSILNKELWKEGLEVKISPLTSKGYFWELVTEDAKIFSVRFILNSPNMLGSVYNNLKDILSYEKQESNANRIEFARTNDAGELKVKKTQFNNEAVGWIEDGAGEWELVVKSSKTGNKKRKIKNTKQLAVFEADVDTEVEDNTYQNANDADIIKKIKAKIDLCKYKIRGKNR